MEQVVGAVCATTRDMDLQKSLGAKKSIHSRQRHWDFYTVGFWNCFDQIVFLPWFLESEVYNLFSILQEPTVERLQTSKKTLDILKKLKF